MQKRTFLWQAHCAVFLAAFGFAALTMAQNPPAAPSSTNDDWLAQARKMYYSSTVSGLKGFDCEMRPNWEALFLTQNGGQMSATNQAKVTLLGSVKVALHARMDGSSVLDWNSPPQQLDADQTKMLSDMHSALDQTLVQGFMQFWTPFIERQVIPDSPSGLEMAATDDGGRKIHIKQPDVELFETFDNGHILREYIVVLTGTKIEITPTYSPSDHGLVITHFHAFIRPADETQKVQEMNVDVGYQWLEGFPIPSRLEMEVLGTAQLKLAFENCTVQH
ncbi:MAG: hypothetical protein WBP85_01565 [Terracidiphilus sp.]